jgi:FdhD protein
LIQYKAYDAQKFQTDAQTFGVSDALVIERPLRIVINGEALSITMQTPGNELDLVRGLLYCEDIYRALSPEPHMTLDAAENGIIDQVQVTIPEAELGQGYANARQMLSVASCGICGRTEFTGRQGKLIHSAVANHEQIHAWFEEMRLGQSLFALTGGCHGAALFSKHGQCIALHEDIGRHNAVDKVIGAALRKGQLKDGQVLLVSGRISYEIVSKCFMAGIPVLAAVSAPSSLAVDFAKELGITLIAFCRDRRMTVYA